MVQLIWVFISLLVLGLGAYLVTVGWGKGKGSWSGDRAEGERPMLFIPGWVLVLVGASAILVLGILWPVQYYQSLGERYSLEGFLATRCSYVQSINEAQSVIIAGAEGKGELVDFAYLAQSGEFTGLVRDLRAKTDWYNTTLRRMETLRHAPIVGPMRVGAGDLQPITALLKGCD